MHNHDAHRGSDVETWIERHRDRYDEGTPQREALDALLSDYGVHAQTGTPLDEEVPSQEEFLESVRQRQRELWQRIAYQAAHQALARHVDVEEVRADAAQRIMLAVTNPLAPVADLAGNGRWGKGQRRDVAGPIAAQSGAPEAIVDAAVRAAATALATGRAER